MAINSIGNSPVATNPPSTRDVGVANFGFGDLLDVVNPLQHLPGISQLYRHFTGDESQGFTHIIGAAIFGGPLGAIGAIASEIVKDSASDESSVALADNAAPQTPHRIRATTKDWLNPKFNVNA